MEDQIDPILQVDLEGIPTGMPIVKTGLADLVVSEIKSVANKQGSGTNINITLKSTDPLESVSGETIEKGFPFYFTISLTPTEKYDPKRRLKEFRLAATGNQTGEFWPLDQYKNKVVRVKLDIQAESTDPNTGETYPERNKVSRFILPK